MLPSFKNTLEFFESMSFDKNAYFILYNKEDFKVCVYYQKNENNRNWAIWFDEFENTSKQTITSKHLQAVIDAFKLEEEDFIKEISHLLFMQVAFADEFIRQSVNLFGKDAVQKSILETQNFMDELGKCVDSVFNNKIDESGKKEENKSRFRIIK